MRRICVSASPGAIGVKSCNHTWAAHHRHSCSHARCLALLMLLMSRLPSHTCAQSNPICKLDLHHTSMVTRQSSAGAVEAYAIDGKPADCTMLALHGPLFQAGNTLHLLKAVSPVVGQSMQRMLNSMLWSQLTCALLFQGQQFDLVVSGINRGDNLGLHVIYSGTVGAAQEAAIKVFLPIAPPNPAATPPHSCLAGLKAFDKQQYCLHLCNIHLVHA